MLYQQCTASRFNAPQRQPLRTNLAEEKGSPRKKSNVCIITLLFTQPPCFSPHRECLCWIRHLSTDAHHQRYDGVRSNHCKCARLMSCPATFKYVVFRSIYLRGYHGVTDWVCVSLYIVKKITRPAVVFYHIWDMSARLGCGCSTDHLWQSCRCQWVLSSNKPQIILFSIPLATRVQELDQNCAHLPWLRIWSHGIFWCIFQIQSVEIMTEWLTWSDPHKLG